MTSFQLLLLLKKEFADHFFEGPDGKTKSTMEALELIEKFKIQTQNETIKNLQSASKKTKVSR